MKYYGWALVPVLGLTACASAPPPLASYNAQENARIRLFFLGPIREGTVSSSLYFNQACYAPSAKPAIRASGSGGMIMGVLGQNKSIGMPASNYVAENSMRRYQEYIIPAAQPLTLKMDWRLYGPQLSGSCDHPAATFTPEAGQDYEASLEFSGTACTLSVRQLGKMAPDRVIAYPMTVPPAADCP